ncbi:MAG: SEFIR domain-containing protein [Saccharofermentanales bacterium]|jgi:hypothetical protein
MKKKIENPKVFISYAWGSDDYENRILAFASQLMGDGIKVVIDKWDLKEGNDTYAFMERCVTDSSITNVLMLLDPIYARKADDHVGGVGTETQIISVKVYQKVDQDKFIPVVMERDEEGNICKPTYLQTRLHFDLSVPEEYDSTYQRLVKTLYGEEIYAKPALGRKPDWVDKPITVSPRTIVRYESLKYSQPMKVKKNIFEKYLKEIQTKLVEYSQGNSQVKTNEEYVLLYDGTGEIKEDFLQLIKNSVYIEDSYKNIAEFFEKTANMLFPNKSLGIEVARIRLHELFLYVVAYYLKNKDYLASGYLLGKTYFNQRQYNDKRKADSFLMFYSGSVHQNLDAAIKARDNINYNTGTGQHWIETLANDFCSKEQLVFADLICFNYSIYGKDYISSRPWFPITYIYENKIDSALSVFAGKMISKDYVQEILPLFGFDTVEAFVTKIKEIEEGPPDPNRICRYSAVFESARILRNFIDADDVASFR